MNSLGFNSTTNNLYCDNVKKKTITVGSVASPVVGAVSYTPGVNRYIIISHFASGLNGPHEIAINMGISSPLSNGYTASFSANILTPNNIIGNPLTIGAACQSTTLINFPINFGTVATSTAYDVKFIIDIFQE